MKSIIQIAQRLKSRNIPSAPKRNKGITAGQLLHELEADPEFVRRRTERERAEAEFLAKSKLDQAPLLEDLARLGLKIDSVWALVNTRLRYREAIPVLLEHLQRPYPDIILEGIARSLAIKPTQKTGWRILVNEYRKLPATSRLKDALAVSLSGASDASVIPELIELAKDKSNGSSRILLLIGIRRSRRQEAKQAIIELANDPQLATEIRSWRKRS